VDVFTVAVFSVDVFTEYQFDGQFDGSVKSVSRMANVYIDLCDGASSR